MMILDADFRALPFVMFSPLTAPQPHGYRLSNSQPSLEAGTPDDQDPKSSTFVKYFVLVSSESFDALFPGEGGAAGDDTLQRRQSTTVSLQAHTPSQRTANPQLEQGEQPLEPL